MSKLNAYLETIARMEPDIAAIDSTAAAASIAISLKRIADYLEALEATTRNAAIAHQIEFKRVASTLERINRFMPNPPA